MSSHFIAVSMEASLIDLTIFLDQIQRQLEHQEQNAIYTQMTAQLLLNVH